MRRFAAERFDVLVIGGGITGAGIARDAALRGLRTALVERGDFASGTSSRSSRLIHGGVRYLEHGHLHLVFEASRERYTLLRIAPHLVQPLAFTWPVYRGARISRLKLAAGLGLYDALAMFRNVALHERLSATETIEREPALRADGLVGGALYFDARTDDARLTLANILGAAEAGSYVYEGSGERAVSAAVLNYAEVTGYVKQDRRAIGAEVLDRLTGERFAVHASAIVNATGPETDALQRLESPEAVHAIRGSKGAHIAVPRARVGNEHAVTMLHPDDGRVMFTLPAGERTIVGTTETPADSGPRDIRASGEDVRYLLRAVNHYFPAARLGDGDVISAWAGIRPLAAGLAGEDASSASREHAIAIGASGVVSVTGGKLTTYRAMAEEVADLLVERVGSPHRQRCITAAYALPGGERGPAADGNGDGVPMSPLEERLTSVYGTRAGLVLHLAAREPALAQPLGDGVPCTGAELVYGVEQEFAVTLGDLLIRRTRAAFETRDHAMSLAPVAARIAGAHLGWDAARERAEVAAYEREVERLEVRTTPSRSSREWS